MKIEDLIKSRRSQLDLDKAPPDTWNTIKKQWKKEGKVSFQWWKVAAMIFVCISIGLLIHNLLLQKQVDELSSLSDISKEHKRLEKDYIQEVNQLEKAISLEDMKGSEEYQWVFEELEILEEVNQMYRSDIGKVNQDELVGVLIDYYEKKIRLLKKLELEIERTKNLKNDEKINPDISSI